MSLRGSTSRSAVACSGLMYAGVPIAIPVAVSRLDSSWSARAMPKSATSAWPRDSRMFSGLISR